MAPTMQEKSMAETPNHEYNVPEEGTQNWHEPLNDNFDALDTDVEIRDDGEPAAAGYDDPADGAKYLDISSGEIFIAADGSWESLGMIGEDGGDGGIESLSGGDGIDPADIGDGDELSVAWADAEDLDENGNVTTDDAPDAGRYLADDEGVRDFTGPAEWENDGETDTNEATGPAATVGGGVDNTASDNGATVGGGDGNEASALDTTVGGGLDNTANALYATVGGGQNNTASDWYATVGGGWLNEASNVNATVGGGSYNWAMADFATIAGGGPSDTNEPADTNNIVYDNYGTIAGGGNNQAGVDDDDPESEAYATVGGGEHNVSSAEYATVGGGRNNTASNRWGTVAGGDDNEASGQWSTVGGGSNNSASGNRAAVAGGRDNTAAGSYATVAGGYLNEATGRGAAIGGGGDVVFDDPDDENLASGDFSTIAGGADNQTPGEYSSVPGGYNNSANGDYSLAAGHRARANDVDGFDVIPAHGSFVWGDSSDNLVRAEDDDRFVVQAGGGAKIYTESDTSQDVGAELPAGEGSWQSLSARAAKSNVSPVEPDAVLEGVTDLDIATWNYNGNEETQHMGPMAEDFHDQFSLGTDDKHLANVDADGVALAAIQGLADRLETKNERINDLEAENKALRERLSAIEAELGIEAAESVPAED